MDQLMALARQFTLGQRVAIIGGVAVFVVAIVGLVSITGAPRYEPAFTRLDPERTGAISEALRAARVPFTVTDAGATIMVPADSVADARVAAAEAGLTDGYSPGFELFDRGSFGMSEFDQRVTYQRALAGELERTIGEMAGIDSVRVAIVPAERTLFSSQDRPASASVMIGMTPGRTPDRALVEAITASVAAAVTGLTPDAVTVVDTSGRVLSAPGDTFGQSPREMQAQVESELAFKVQALLDRTLGAGRSSVAVTIDLDLDRVEETIKSYQPITADNWTPVSVNRITEVYGPDALPGSGGVVGPGSNIPGLPTYPGLPAPSGSAAPSTSPAPSGSPAPSTSPDPDATPLPSATPAEPAPTVPANGYVRTQETVNYSLSETVSHIIREPGTIKRLSVAVLTDSAASADVDAAALQAAISAALGIDAARGDQVSVSSVPFASAPDGGEEPPAEPAAPQIAEMLEYAKIGGALLFALLLLLILWRSARGVRRRAEEIAFGVAPEAAADPRTIVAQVGGRASDDDPGAAVVPNPHIVVQERLRELAQQRPEQVAGMASQWLNGED